MPDIHDRIKQLIGDDKVEKAIDDLLHHLGGDDEPAAELVALQAELTSLKKESRRGLLTNADLNKGKARIRYALLDLLKEIPEARSASTLSPEGAPAPTAAPAIAVPAVFISYNHADSEIADKLKTALEQNGVAVRIDRAAMAAGANIQEFIETSIRDTDVTLSIVSNRSLQSAWVALESIDTFHHEKVKGGKRFIACYVDDDFFRTGFGLEAIQGIDAKIAEIDELAIKYAAQKIDTRDLNNQKTRLFNLRNNLGDILLRLTESLCVDIRGDKFEESVKKIIRAIKGDAAPA